MVEKIWFCPLNLKCLATPMLPGNCVYSKIMFDRKKFTLPGNFLYTVCAGSTARTRARTLRDGADKGTLLPVFEDDKEVLPAFRTMKPARDIECYVNPPGREKGDKIEEKEQG